jgi:hypothetical protein
MDIFKMTEKLLKLSRCRKYSPKCLICFWKSKLKNKKI